MIITEILSWIGQLAVQAISTLGYGGVLLFMAMESMIFPVPSELVMPFAGFLIAKGTFSWPWVILFSSLGTMIGSLLSYFIGKYGGKAFLIRYGKYLFLDQHDLQKTELWFAKKGDKTIFFSRFIPVVRHLISIPAGIGKMNLKKFCIYTLIGATLWNTFLAYLGFKLGEHWNEVRNYSEYASIPVALIIILIGSYFVYRHIKNHKTTVPS